MIIELSNHPTVDTDRDLSSEERHILQKLLCYVHFVGSVAEFREKKAKAFQVGWDNSGPVSERPVMAKVAEKLEQDIRLRLSKNAAGK